MRMSRRTPIRLALPFFLAVSCGLRAEISDTLKPAAEDAHRHGPSCLAEDNFFLDEVWTKIAAQACLKCHKAGGDAEDSKLVLQDPARDKEPGEALRHNRSA